MMVGPRTPVQEMGVLGVGCRLQEPGTSPAEPLVSSQYRVFTLSLIFVGFAVSSNPRNVTSVFGSSPQESCPVHKWDQVCQLHLAAPCHRVPKNLRTACCHVGRARVGPCVSESPNIDCSP